MHSICFLDFFNRAARGSEPCSEGAQVVTSHGGD